MPETVKRAGRFLRDKMRRQAAAISLYSEVHRRGLGLVTRRFLMRSKRSDRLFILATGGSINSLTSDQWEEIRNGDSLGLNYWILHGYVPTFYSGEFMGDGDRLEDYRHNLRVAAPRYVECTSFFRLRNRSVLEQSDVIREFGGRVALQEWVRGYTEAEVTRSVRDLHPRRRGFPARLLHHASSLDTAILLGAYLGYQRIILCGVDLNNVEYFFHADPNRFTARGFRIPRTGQRAAIHRTNDPAQKNVPVSSVVRSVRGRPDAPEIFVAHPRSALHPEVPLYPWS